MALFSLETVRTPGKRPPFRADIEGLRGIAVLLVVLYHAGVPGFAGGFVGVDVFFALSGYLITGILVAEIEATGRLDFARFYARRARRLLPAMSVLLVVVAAVALAFYSPVGQQQIATTALATAAYASNFYFASGATDYLAADAETNPLLHTWSLAVEEQFYLLWPVIVFVGLIGLKRRTSPVRLGWTMVILSVASFALSLYLMATLRTHWSFFASPPRAWEFAIGGLGAMLPRVRLRSARRGPAPSFRLELAGWLGLAAVLAAGVLYTARTPFPGWTALIPVLGTVMALRAGADGSPSPLRRMLTWRPLCEAGRLSYSWYLWHWPVLVFAVGIYGEVPLGVRLILLAVSLGLAEASYRWVENPVRYHRGLAKRSAYGLALLAGITIGSVALTALWRTTATAASTSDDQILFTRAAEDRDIGKRCIARTEDVDLLDCTYGDPGSSKVIVLFGDSHAYQWLPALELIASERGWRLETVMKSACAGTVDATRWSERLGREYAECDEWRSRALDRIDALQPDLIVASSSVGSFSSIDRSEWVDGMVRVLSRLSQSDRPVLLIRDTPLPGVDVPSCLSKRAWVSDAPSDACTFEVVPEQDTDVYGAQRTAAQHTGITLADFTTSVCPSSPCTTIRGDSLVVWRDDNHLTVSFARTLAPALAIAVDDAMSHGVRPPPPLQ